MFPPRKPIRAGWLVGVFLVFASLDLGQVAQAVEPEPADAFTTTIRPVLVEYCSDCHHPDDSDNKVPFLKAASADDVADGRRIWNNVAAQLRNRTMPPADDLQPPESERFRLATWVEQWLRATACRDGEFAGSVTVRRLNRREYDNTIRDLFGLELMFAETFPMDGSGGEGFDNNGETLFLPPMLIERYLEAAQEIVDAAIVTPRLDHTYAADELLPVQPDGVNGPRLLSAGEQLTALVAIYETGEFTITVEAEPDQAAEILVLLQIDGITAHRFKLQPMDFDNDAQSVSRRDAASSRMAVVRLPRGLHSVALRPVQTDARLAVSNLRVQENRKFPTAREQAIHEKLLGLKVGQSPPDGRAAAREFIAEFVKRAFRRPVTLAEVERFLGLYDRSQDRGDPYEESIKLVLKGVLISPDFLFRMEQEPTAPGIHPLTDHELATRLSYFLWESMPDAELTLLADETRLQNPEVLVRQVERMLDDSRSEAFTESFIGQWLGTKDVGGRVAPTVNEIQDFYTPEIAADMRHEPVLLFRHLLQEDRSLLEFLDADYTFLTRRLAEHYRLENIGELAEDSFQRFELSDKRRGGLLGFGGVLAMTSHFKQTSPVLRGAWVLETLLGAPVPTPPPGIPALDESAQKSKNLTVREKLEQHRNNPNCAACHDLIDPIGFGLENFDYLGRWRDDDEGRPLDVTGTMPSGESFNGPAELKQVLLGRKQEFLRQLTAKMLGFALGRSLEDADQCTIEGIVRDLEQSDYRARTLVRSVVLSVPFRYCQATADAAENAETNFATGSQ